jgi:hypothetical protein
VARPGCSLLPVALPADPDRASLGTVEQACAVLGRPMPEARTLPTGVTRGEIGIDGPGPNGCCRMVHVSYLTAGLGVAVLDIGTGDIPVANKGSINGTVSGAPAIVAQRKNPSSSGDIVTYLWSREGLLLSMLVRLDGAVSREDADRMADSVR